MPIFTLQALQQRVLDGLDQNNLFFPTGNTRSVLNEGLRRLQLLCAFSQVTVPVPGATVADQLIYRTPPEITIPLRVYYEKIELSKASIRQIATKYRTWTTDSNATRGPVSEWAPIDIRQFIIHPIDAGGGRLLEVNGIAKITPLVEPTDVIALDNQYCDILIDYCKSRIMLKEGGANFAISSTTSYAEMVRKIKAMTVWQGVKFNNYWLIKQEEPDEAKGT